MSGRKREITAYAATSVWAPDDDSGVVFHRGNSVARIVHAHYHHYYAAPHAALMRSEWSPRQYVAFSRTYAHSHRQYGPPSVSPDDDTLPATFEDRPDADREVDAYTRDQLSKRGYVEQPPVVT